MGASSPQSWKRACDICGYNGPFSKLKHIGQGRYACPDDAPGMTAEQLARHAARQKPVTVRPRRDAKIQGDVPSYLGDEGYAFNLICKYAVTASVIGLSGYIATAHSTLSAANCGLYLRELLLENKRPLSWMTRGLVALKQVGDYLLTQQYGAQTGPSPSEATSSVLYGGVLQGLVVNTTVTWTAGTVFLGLFSLTGETAWLDAADRCAWYMRQCQRGDLLTANWTQDLSGNRLFVGGWTSSVAVSSKQPFGIFFLFEAGGLWFMRKYRDVRGAARILGTTTATGDFATAPSGTVQQCIDDALAFYVTGRFPYSASDLTLVAPLSTTSPQLSFDLTLVQRWSNSVTSTGTGMSTTFFATALRGLYEYEGYTARVATMFEWLMAFTSAPAFATPANTPLSVLAAGATGTMDPTVVLPLTLEFGPAGRAPTITTNATARVSPVATALLGPLYEASGRGLREWKDALSVRRPSSAQPTQRIRLITLANSVGLSFQALTTDIGQPALTTLAQNALVYRAAPKAYPELRGLP